MRKRVFAYLIAAAMMLSVCACVPSVTLKTEALSKGAPKGEAVVVGNVVNKRAAGFGSEDFRRLGTVRGGFGNPFALKTDSDSEIDAVLKEVSKSALDHAGFSTEARRGKALRLDVDVLKLWCDGYTGYKVDADVVVKLVDAATGNVLTQKEIKAEKEFAILFGYNAMHDAFNDVISQIQKETVAFVGSEKFARSAK